VLTIALEQLEQKFALSEGVASSDDLDLYQRMSSALRRLLESVHSGLERRAKDVTSDTDDERFLHMLEAADAEEASP
jgi:hypothetical protein